MNIEHALSELSALFINPVYLDSFEAPGVGQAYFTATFSLGGNEVVPLSITFLYDPDEPQSDGYSVVLYTEKGTYINGVHSPSALVDPLSNALSYELENYVRLALREDGVAC